MFPLEFLSQYVYLRVSVSFGSFLENFITLLLLLSTSTCFVQYFVVNTIACRVEGDNQNGLRNIELSCLANGTGITHKNETVDFAHYPYIPSFFAVILMAFMVKNLLTQKVFEHYTDWNSVKTFVKEKKGDALFNAVKCAIHNAKQRPGITTLMMLKCIVEFLVLSVMLVSIPLFMGIPIGTFFTSVLSDWKRMAAFFPFDILCHIFLPSVGNVNRLSVPCLLSANKWYTVVTVFISYLLIVSAALVLLIAITDALFLVRSKVPFVTQLIEVSNRCKDVNPRQVEKYVAHMTTDGMYLIRLMRIEFGLFTASQFVGVSFTNYCKFNPLLEDLMDVERPTTTAPTVDADVEAIAAAPAIQNQESPSNSSRNASTQTPASKARRLMNFLETSFHTYTNKTGKTSVTEVVEKDVLLTEQDQHSNNVSTNADKSDVQQDQSLLAEIIDETNALLLKEN